MSILQLDISHLRNLSSVKLSLSPQTNLISGPNGSGKTSILEAAYLLSHGRSFRTGNYRHYISHEEAACTLFGRCHSPAGGMHQIGLERLRSGEQRIRVDGESVESAATLAELLPVQLINADAFRLLEGSPSVRRQFIDWGVFHSEPGFMTAWRALRRCLQQRNSLLKCGKMSASIREAWDQEFIKWSNALDQYRQTYLDQLLPTFQRLLSELLTLDGLTLSYYRGWDSKRRLDEVLAGNFQRDSQLGYTQQGPQRADLKVRVHGASAADILSRGQQKLIVSALKVAQGHLLQSMSRRACTYLIDDLPAELDSRHRQALCALLEDLQCQVLITCVEAESLAGCWTPEREIASFNVIQGSLAPTS